MFSIYVVVSRVVSLPRARNTCKAADDDVSADDVSVAQASDSSGDDGQVGADHEVDSSQDDGTVGSALAVKKALSRLCHCDVACCGWGM